MGNITLLKPSLVAVLGLAFLAVGGAYILFALAQIIIGIIFLPVAV